MPNRALTDEESSALILDNGPNIDLESKNSIIRLLDPYKDTTSNLFNIDIYHRKGEFGSDKLENKDLVNLLTKLHNADPDVFHRSRPSTTLISKILTILNKK